MKTYRHLVLVSFIAATTLQASAQTAATEPATEKPKWDYQIFLTKPATEIKEVVYDKDCSAVKANLSEDKKQVILKDYEQGKRVYVKIKYEDGSEEEFVRSSCFIDPVL